MKTKIKIKKKKSKNDDKSPVMKIKIIPRAGQV